MYVLWAFLPSPFLHQMGIYYYPNRWWALAIPAWLVMAVGYIYIALGAYNTQYLTLKMGSVEAIVDNAAQVALVDARGRVVKGNTLPSKLPKGGRGGKAHSRTNSASGLHRSGWMMGGEDVNLKNVWNHGTDAVMDVPLGGVCEILYGDWREDEEISNDYSTVTDDVDS